jgi:DNA-binding HxlR family transcriptional regulator
MSKRQAPERDVPRGEHGQLLFDVFDRECPSRFALENITSRWGILILAALHDGEARFSALRRRVGGVSEKMLAQSLQALERDGFVHRSAQATIPPRVDYDLTPLGREMADRIVDLIQQLETRMEAVRMAQGVYDKAKAGG